MTFILQKASAAQNIRMRGSVFTILAVGAAMTVAVAPGTASARETEQVENTNCTCKSQRRMVRPLTESMPIRKKDKERMRRILM